MKKKIKNIIVGITVIVIWVSVANQYVNFFEQNIAFHVFLESVVFNPQKLLFNNLLGAMLCIYVNTYDLNRIEYVIRMRKGILLEQVVLGVEVCSAYTMLVLMSVIVPVFNNLKFTEYSIITFLQSWLRLFVIDFMFFIIFIFFSTFIKRVAALFLLIAIGFILLTGWNIYSFHSLNANTFFVTQSAWFHVIMILVVSVIIRYNLKKKEYYS